MMHIGFNTLGCPDWSLDDICRKGSAMGFEGVDFRGMQDQIDITVMPEFTVHLAESKRRFADAGLRVSGISTSLKICEPDRRADNLEEARRTIPLAHELSVDTLRVFGGGDPAIHTKEEMADIGRDMMASVLDLDGARSFKWILETHDQWIRAVDCKLLLDRIPDEEFGMLWDMGHTARVGEEAPETSMAAMGGRIYGLHVKDAVYDTAHPNAMNDGWRYVVPGTGQLPLAEAIALLKARGYDGWLLFEHEKRWHADLPEPEEMFPKFMDWYSRL